MSRNILQKMKQSKRRLVQQTRQKMGISTASRDVEWEDAVNNFMALDRTILEILRSIKEALYQMNQASVTNASLGRTLSAFFNSVDEADREDSLVNSSGDFLRATKENADLQAGCSQFLENHVVGEIQKIVSQTFPEIKRKITEHNGLKTDVESYQRRLKGLQQKGKTDADPDILKLHSKFGRANSQFNVMHPELLQELRDIYDNRHNIVNPHFITLVACQNKIANQLASELSNTVNSISEKYDINVIQRDINSLETTSFATLSMRSCSSSDNNATATNTDKDIFQPSISDTTSPTCENNSPDFDENENENVNVNVNYLADVTKSTTQKMVPPPRPVPYASNTSAKVPPPPPPPNSSSLSASTASPYLSDITNA